jgi:Uma2 family endonuclease
MASTKLYTAEDLLEMEDDGCRHELIRGELISMPPTNDEHSELTFKLSGLLWNYQREHPEIRWFTGDPGFVLARNPDVLLGPDLAAVHTDRLPPDFPRRSFFDIVPDLVIEIVSPSERAGQTSAKVDAYLEAGVRLIWLINPMHRSVTVHSPDQHTQILEGDDVLDGGEVLPEFRLQLGELFG